MSELIKNIFEIKKSKSYIAYNKYHMGNIFGITKMSRRELMHSNFIAWALNANSSHALGLFPIYQFIRAVCIIQSGADNTLSRKIDSSLVYKLFGDSFITNVSVKREDSVRLGGTVKHIDLVIEINTTEKILPVIIENKVESKENGSDGDQTVTYFNWGEQEYGDRSKYFEPIYVFLYPEYNSTMQKSKEYIRMTYQQLVDYVLEPSMEKCGDSVSIGNYRAYLQCLSFQSDNEKGENTMAISSEERKILDDFISENRDLLLAVANEMRDEIDPKALSAFTGAVRDYSKYSLDGTEYKKAKLALAIVKKYIAANPIATYADLQNVFPVTLSFDKKPLIRLKGDITAKEQADKRVFVSDGITLSDGTEIFINSQVQGADMPQILDIANKLGYNITKI